MIEAIEAAEIHWHTPPLEKVSAECRELLGALLTADPAARPPIEAVLKFKWLRDVAPDKAMLQLLALPLPEVPNSQDEDGGGEDLDAEADAEAAAGADAEGEPAETPAVIKKIQ